MENVPQVMQLGLEGPGTRVCGLDHQLCCLAAGSLRHCAELNVEQGS